MAERMDGHALEERMLKEASRLRKEAQQLREERLRGRQEEAASGLEKLRQAETAEKKRKAVRDAEIRAFLLPLAEAFKRTGWRVKAPAWSTDPVFTLTRSNQYPPEEIRIYWKNPGLSGQLGFYWE